MENTTNYYPTKSKLFFIDDLNASQYGVYFNGHPFTGIRETITTKEYKKSTFVDRRPHGIEFTKCEKFFSIIIYLYNQSRYTFQIFKRYPQESNFDFHTAYDLDTLELIMDYKPIENGKRRHYEGYNFTREDLDYDKKIKYSSEVLQIYLDHRETFYDMGLFVHSYSYSNNPFDLTRELNEARIGKAVYAYVVQESMNETLGYTVEDDFMEKYVLQNEIAEKIIKEGQIQYPIKYIAGVSVAYNDIEQKMVSAVVVMNIETQEIVERAFSETEDVTLHVPDLFAYNEVPSVIKAFEKLNIKPQLIFCDGHGIEHPRNAGLATHLGIELDIPTIGCPKKRLVGYYEKTNLGDFREDSEELWFDDKIVGKALRTQKNSNPLYVSIGHRISLETAIEWVLKITPNSRIPIVVQEAISITEQLLPQRIRYDFLDDEENKYGMLI
jgi:deoxyinosine 3'endonuclease (endonuclease V)